MKLIFFFAIALFLMTVDAQATGTINLSINSTPYCATTQSGNNFSGVVAGSCTTPPPASCPAGRYTTGSIEYYGCGANCPSTLRNQDLTRFENIWGRFQPGQTPIMWPGDSHSFVYLLNFPRTGYIAAKFHTPASGAPLVGWMSMPEYFAVDMALSISPNCGDFNPTMSACFTPSVATHGFVLWRYNSTNSGCRLQPNTDYYLNVKLANPNQTSPYCTGSTCNIGGINNFH